MHNLCNCPNCQTNNCPAAAELEALTKQVELLKAGNLDNEEEIQGWANAKGKLEKEFDSLRTQNRELRELLTKTRQYVQDRLRENQKALANADPDSQFYGEDICSMPLLANIDKALAATEVKDRCPKCGGRIVSRSVVGIDRHGREQEADWSECETCARIKEVEGCE